MHGDLGQGAREQALRAFRNGKVDVLVATDVAARGIDVEDVTHVVNYQCPEDEKTYLHRIGRTGRAGATGVAITFVDWDDLPRWSADRQGPRPGFGEPQETYSTSDAPLRGARHPGRTSPACCPAPQRTRAGLDAEEVEDLGETGRAGRGRGAQSAPAARVAAADRGVRGGRAATAAVAAPGATAAAVVAERLRRERSAGPAAAGPPTVRPTTADTASATDGGDPAAAPAPRSRGGKQARTPAQAARTSHPRRT